MQSLVPIAEKIAGVLIARKETIAVAESSTGGLIAAALLAVPGASAYFLGGAVVYTRASRTALLGISDAEMEGLRASTETYALLIARRVRERHGATWGLGGNRCDRANRQPLRRCGGSYLLERRRPGRAGDYIGNGECRPAGEYGMPSPSARWSFSWKRYRPRNRADYSAASAISERTTARSSSISLRPFGVCRCQKVQPLQASRPCASAPMR